MDQNRKDTDKKSDHSHVSCDSPEEEKPLKKARYIWEVKGKQSMKGDPAEEGEFQESNSSMSKTVPEYGDSQSQSARLQEVADEDLSNPQESSAGPSRCCFGDIIERSSDAIDRVMETALNEQYGSEDDKSSSKNEEGESQPKNSLGGSSREEGYEDYLILKWQARQIARGYVDNTINTMLETEMYERPSARPVRPRRILMFEAPHRRIFREDSDGDNSRVDFVAVEPEFNVEHEAIFEAIKTHGLQSKESTSTAEPSESGQEERDNKSDDRGQTSVEQEKPSINPNSVATTSQISSPRRPTVLSTVPSDINEVTDCLEASKTVVVESEELCQSFSCDVTADPLDFLSAAVSVAIQKKGLTCG